MQNATQLARTPPIADLKRRSGRSSVFKAIKKSFSTTSLSSVFRKPSTVSTSPILHPVADRHFSYMQSNIYGDTYSLDVAPSDIFERMLRDDIVRTTLLLYASYSLILRLHRLQRTTGLGDRTPYNNGAIHGRLPSRSAFHLSYNYRPNASTIPTLFVATNPKVTPQSHLSRGTSPLRSQLPNPNHSPQMAEVVKNPVTLHPVSPPPCYSVVSPSSTLPQLGTVQSLRMHTTIKDLPEQPLSTSPIQQWFDQFHARVDSVASGSTGSIKSRHSPSPRSPGKDDSNSRKISYTSMSVALSTSVTDLERRYEQRYGQKALENYKPRQGVVYLEHPLHRCRG